MPVPKKKTTSRRRDARRSHILRKLQRAVNRTSPVKVGTRRRPIKKPSETSASIDPVKSVGAEKNSATKKLAKPTPKATAETAASSKKKTDSKKTKK